MIQPLPYLSILINNYNYARFIDQSIDSCLSQTYSQYEIIVVDDCSTDNSLKVCTSYGDKIKLISHSVNKGQGATFNTGIEKCKGDYICLLDADDIFLPHKLQVIADTLQSIQYKPDLIHHQIYRVNQNLIRTDDQAFPLLPFTGDVSHYTKKYGKKLSAPTSGLIFKKSFLKNVLPLYPFENRLGPDVTLKLLVYMLGNIYAISQPLSLYRLHGDNHFCNHAQAQGNFSEISKNIADIEIIYENVNHKFKELNLLKNVDVNKNIYFQAMQVIIGKRSILNFIINLFISPVFDSRDDKLKLFKWVITLTKFNQTQRFSHINC